MTILIELKYCVGGQIVRIDSESRRDILQRRGSCCRTTRSKAGETVSKVPMLCSNGTAADGYICMNDLCDIVADRMKTRKNGSDNWNQRSAWLAKLSGEEPIHVSEHKHIWPLYLGNDQYIGTTIINGNGTCLLWITVV